MKKYRRVMSRDNEEWCKVWIKTDSWFQKYEKSENVHFHVLLLCQKYIMFEPKKYRGVIYHNTEEWCKIWRETDLSFEEKLWGMTWEILRLLTQHWKVSKFAFYRLLLTKVYNVWAKMYSWSTSPEHSKILKFAFWEIFLSKVYIVELKHYRDVLCHDTEGWCNI